MKDIKLMDGRDLIKKAVNVLMHELGPMEATRFLTLMSGKGRDSVKIHRRWQSKLNKDEFFKQVFSSK